MLLSEKFDDVDLSKPIFPPLVVWSAISLYCISAFVLLGLYWCRRTAVIGDGDQLVCATIVGASVCMGVFLIAAVHDAWAMGFNLFRQVPNGFVAALQLVALFVASWFAGNFVAVLWTEWYAFHGFTPTQRQETFLVVEHHWGTRAPDWLRLESQSSNLKFSINCGFHHCSNSATGSLIRLSVETGRGGVQRVTLPATI